MYSQTSIIRLSMGAINFAGLRRLLDYQVTSVIEIVQYLGLCSKLQVKPGADLGIFERGAKLDRDIGN